MFIVMEGIDGCGKNTQLLLLQNYMRDKGRRVAIVHDPGTTPAGVGIRKMLLDAKVEMSADVQALLYTAARRSLVEYIGDLRRGGIDVLCGRWVMSTRVYQGFVQKVGDRSVMDLHNRWVRLDPDVYVVLDLPAGLAHERLHYEKADECCSVGAEASESDPTTELAPEFHPDQDRFESQGIPFLEELRKGYRLCAEDTPNAWIVDASVTEQEVFKTVLSACAMKSKQFADLFGGYYETGLCG